MGTLGDRLRRSREQKRWSQLDVAAKTGISNMSISNYEREEREPSLETLARLAELYAVSIDWLATGREWTGAGVADLWDMLRGDVLFRGVAMTEEEKNRITDMLFAMMWDRLPAESREPFRN